MGQEFHICDYFILTIYDSRGSAARMRIVDFTIKPTYAYPNRPNLAW